MGHRHILQHRDPLLFLVGGKHLQSVANLFDIVMSRILLSATKLYLLLFTLQTKNKKERVICFASENTKMFQRIWKKIRLLNYGQLIV